MKRIIVIPFLIVAFVGLVAPASAAPLIPIEYNVQLPDGQGGACVKRGSECQPWEDGITSPADDGGTAECVCRPRTPWGGLVCIWT